METMVRKMPPQGSEELSGGTVNIVAFLRRLEAYSLVSVSGLVKQQPPERCEDEGDDFD